MDTRGEMPSTVTQNQGWSTGHWKFSAWEIAAFEALQPDFDLEPPLSIVLEYAH
jgi:hypothetical protein